MFVVEPRSDYRRDEELSHTHARTLVDTQIHFNKGAGNVPEIRLCGDRR